MAIISATRRGFLRRLVGAAMLEVATYEEVEADRHSTAQALAIVVLSSLAIGLGARGFGGRVVDVASFSVAALMIWAAWALVTFQIGARILPDPETRVDLGELLRTTGFAATPGLFAILGIFPGMTIPVFAVVALWMLLTMIVAVRQALDYTSTGRAVAVCSMGWILAIACGLVLGFFFGPHLS